MATVTTVGSKDISRETVQDSVPSGTKGRGNTKLIRQDNDSSDCDALIVGHEALQVGVGSSWIVDSGVAYHMCNERSMFVEYQSFRNGAEKVTLGDGHWLNAIGRGTVELMMNLKRRCKLYDVLFVPGLSYSISKVSKLGKVAKFSESGCQITNSENKLISCASKCGSLYFLECESWDQANTVLTNEDVWHRRYGHLGVQLAVDSLVNGFDYDSSKRVEFCEPCTKGKHHRSPFPTDGGRLAGSRSY